MVEAIRAAVLFGFVVASTEAAAFVTGGSFKEGETVFEGEG